MLSRLIEYKNRKKFFDYEKSVNELYDMFCDMKHLTKNDLSVYEKATALDEAYGDMKTYVNIRKHIINEYKDYNIEYKKSKQPKNTFKREFVADELKKEDCELISDYINSNEIIRYKYDGKEYSCTFAQWRNKGYRPHQRYYANGSYWKEIHEYKKQHPFS